MQTQVGDTLSKKLANPGDVYAPARVAAIGQVNKNYQSIGDRLSANYAGRGMGRSGKVLTNARALETSRAGTIAGVDTQFAGMQTDYETNLLKQAQQYGFTNPGNQQSGNVAGGALDGGLSALTTMLTLNKLLSGGGGIQNPGSIGGGAAPWMMDAAGVGG